MPWASGRVLTEHQRARKREVDRIAQRQRRRKNESRIEEFEAKLESMAAQLKFLAEKGGQVGCAPGDLEKVTDSGHSNVQEYPL